MVQKGFQVTVAKLSQCKKRVQHRSTENREMIDRQIDRLIDRLLDG